ncbi:hypothetical protein AVEN_213102-1 [Araneus ventricosus]|uniref:Ig-like domain-containing protein n=2 Tax=Araneus ventricosus TaxID=182803 RepID=A0A4Y1ZQD2_ARAVE|nr:hypothetical protein AVEN_213102-1 [Araneus ventricosus]
MNWTLPTWLVIYPTPCCNVPLRCSEMGCGWSKDGSDLTIDGEHVELRKEEADDSLTVIVHNCTTEDTGTYKCTITNSEGSETTKSEVKVKEDVKAPTFTKQLKDMTVTEGETVEFSVKFSGKPKVKW